MKGPQGAAPYRVLWKPRHPGLAGRGERLDVRRRGPHPWFCGTASDSKKRKRPKERGKEREKRAAENLGERATREERSDPVPPPRRVLGRKGSSGLVGNADDVIVCVPRRI